jgi:hypothetical protein
VTYVQKGSSDRSLRCLVEIGVMEHDLWRFSAEFHESWFAMPRRQASNDLTHGRTPCKVNLLDRRLGYESL